MWYRESQPRKIIGDFYFLGLLTTELEDEGGLGGSVLGLMEEIRPSQTA